MENKKFGSLSSSVDPSKMGMTASAVILGLSTLIVFFGSKLGVSVTSGDIQAIANAAGTIGTQLGIAASSIGIIYGLIRKGVAAFYARQN